MKYQGVQKKFLFDEEDLVGECWVLFQNVLNNFGRLNKIEGRRNGEFDDHNIEYDYSIKGFSGYLTKTLQRELHAIYVRNFSKGEEASADDTDRYWESIDRSDNTLESEMEMLDISNPEPKLYGLTEVESLIYNTRINDLPTNKFLKLYPEISYAEYYIHLESIRTKIAAVIGREYVPDKK